MKTFVLIVAMSVCVALAFAGEASSINDPCAVYSNCQTCVSHHLCGWCSQDVVYPGPGGKNITGKQCAGFNPHGKDPFACDGIYSTEQCVQGYVCNQETFTCEKGAPGTGNTLQVCEANCTNNGKVFLCNHTTKQCHVVPDGTPGSSSLEVCEASCTHPSAHPSSPNPASPHPAETYACNVSTGDCEVTTPGHGSSKSVCENDCKKGQHKYLCNSVLHQCIALPPGSPGGMDHAACEAECNPKPNPGPPAIFKGVWRGIEIQNNYHTGEWDLNITESSVVMVNVAAAATIRGVPSQLSENGEAVLIIQITSGPGMGKTMKAIGKTDNSGPETNFLTAAFAAPGDNAPTSIAAAMTSSNGGMVLGLATCIENVDCFFSMPVTERVAKAQSIDVVEEITATNDHCTQFAANCSYCISHEYCGWCSNPVTYKDGTKGTQCAGQNPNSSNAFVCMGRYSTEDCNVGYNCDKDKGQCVPNPIPGNGIPKNECEEICHPTPSPTPRPDMYVCNITTKQCHKCNQTFCPGAMPKGTCASACVKPKPGPTSLVIGIWRGLEIQNNYPVGEVSFVFNASGFKHYFKGQEVSSGTVVSFGGDVMILEGKSGQLAGKKMSAIYTIQDQGSMYEWMTLAASPAGGAIPTAYEPIMTESDAHEYILAKCNQHPCKFSPPGGN